WLNKALTFGLILCVTEPSPTRRLMELVLPKGMSQGRRVRKLMVPDIPLTNMLAVGDLYTSTPANRLGGVELKLGCTELMLAADKKTPPLSRVLTCGKPRIFTVEPSPPVRLICTPGTRCSDPAMVRSGRR